MAKKKAEVPKPAGSTPEELAVLLKSAGATRVSAAKIRADIKAGAPATEGRLRLVDYAAWLVKQHGT